MTTESAESIAKFKKELASFDDECVRRLITLINHSEHRYTKAIVAKLKLGINPPPIDELAKTYYEIVDGIPKDAVAAVGITKQLDRELVDKVYIIPNHVVSDYCYRTFNSAPEPLFCFATEDTEFTKAPLNGDLATSYGIEPPLRYLTVEEMVNILTKDEAVRERFISELNQKMGIGKDDNISDGSN